MEDEDLFFVDKTGDTFGSSRFGALLEDEGPRITKEETSLANALFGGVALDHEDEDVSRVNALVEGVSEPLKRSRSAAPENVSAAAWVDEDDDQDVKRGRTEAVLREEFQQATPAWAKPQDDEASSLFLTTAAVTAASSSAVLEPGLLQLKRLPNLNAEARSDAPVSSVQFSKSSLLALTAGRDKTLRLFQVGEKKCTKLHSMFFADLPMKRALFVPRSNDVLCLGVRRVFYFYDMEADETQRVPYLNRQPEASWDDVVASPDGMYSAFLGGVSGNVVLYSNRSRQVAHVLKPGCAVSQATFAAHDGPYMWTSGHDGRVYKWDIRSTRRCVARFNDKGSIGTCSLANSPDGRWQAVGDKSGIVNIYDLSTPEAEQGVPFKSLGNLVTATDKLCWSNDSQILSMSSSKMPQALRMVHAPTFTVFKNWPSQTSHLQVVTDVDFSPNDGYFAVGNQKGEALLMRMLSKGNTVF